MICMGLSPDGSHQICLCPPSRSPPTAGPAASAGCSSCLTGHAMSDQDIAEQFGTGGWRFTRDVVAVFDDHVRQSVPFYDDIQTLVAQVSDWLLPAGSLVADLGASTGNTELAILKRHPDRGLRFALYDESAEMLDQARPLIEQAAPGRVDTYPLRLPAPLQHKNADLTLCLFTLQFLSRADRLELLHLARQHASVTGALIVAEKIRPTDTRWAEIGNDISHDYKAAAGVTDTAIRAKASSLRGVLIPYPQRDTESLIQLAGWLPPETLFRWHNWAVMGAFTTP